MEKHFVEAEELQAYLDRELDPARQAEIQHHLVKCQECAALVADLKRVSATLQRWQVEPAPVTLRPPAVAEHRPQHTRSWGRLAMGLAGGVLVVLLVAAISIPNLLRSRVATQRRSTLSVEQAAPMISEFETAPKDILGVAPSAVPTPRAAGRMIAYRVTMTIEVKQFDPAKKHLVSIVEEAGGYVSQARTAETPNQPRRAELTVHVPATQLSAVLERMRKLGRVTQEQLSSEEVTEQVVDLEARLRNARATEQRLIAVLNNRTGKVRDILEVEREIARTREAIERMEAQRQNLLHRAELATLQVTLLEEFKAQLEPAPVGTLTRLRNAFVEGYDSFVASVLGLTFFFARYGLVLLFWGSLVWLTWRVLRGPLLRIARPRG